MDDPQDDNTMGTPPADDSQAPAGGDDNSGTPEPTASEPETPAAEGGDEAPTAGGDAPKVDEDAGGDTGTDAGSAAA